MQGRYRSRSVIHAGGAFELCAVVRDDGEARAAVTGAPGSDTDAVRVALRKVADAHARIDHPLVPAAAFVEHDGAPWVELDFAAVADGHEVLRRTARSGRKLSYTDGDTLFTSMREALQAAHAVTDAATGAPLCIGRLCLGNFLFSRDGDLRVIGFGHNVALALEHGDPDGTCAVFQAPEVAIGRPPTPGGDYVAVLLAARSLVTFADMTGLTRRVLRGGVLRAENLELLGLVRYFETRWVSAGNQPRPSIEEGLRASERVREILGTRIDRDHLRETLASILSESRLDRSIPSFTLTLDRDGAWAALGGGPRVHLGPAAWRVLSLLAREHVDAPGHAVSVWDLYEVGWPGERVAPESGANRVYVVLSRLRERGFRDLLERSGEGYRLRRDVAVAFA